MDIYPERAGFSETTTSKDAADAIEGSGKAQTLRDEVVRVLRLEHNLAMTFPITLASMGIGSVYGLTADEIAAELGESVFSVRPRVAELHKQGIVEPTGERRKSSNGRACHVWRLK